MAMAVAPAAMVTLLIMTVDRIRLGERGRFQWCVDVSGRCLGDTLSPAAKEHFWPRLRSLRASATWFHGFWRMFPNRQFYIS